MSHLCACIGSPCLKQCVPGDPIGGRAPHSLREVGRQGSLDAVRADAEAVSSAAELGDGARARAVVGRGQQQAEEEAAAEAEASVVTLSLRGPRPWAVSLAGPSAASLHAEISSCWATAAAEVRAGLLGCDLPTACKMASRRAFPSCTRSMLTEIYLRHPCSCHAIAGPPPRRRCGGRLCCATGLIGADAPRPAP
eukprot:SAG25_NODE_407_length_8435_cov_46.995082_5_plen_195_part_00